MNNNETNSVMNVDDYENMAVQKSNNAKRVAAGAALFVGGAAIAGGAAYAATGSEKSDETDNGPLTAEDVVEGGNVGNDYQPKTHNETTERTIYVERPQEENHDQDSEQQDETQVTWDEKTVVYDENGNVVGSTESGTVQGHKFALFDVDGDNHADYLAIDADDNGVFDDNEIIKYEVSDHVHMGHDTAHTKEIHNNNQYILLEDDSRDIARNDDGEIIHNNFEDEKTGESYSGDYAENNSDYNPDADVDSYGNSNNYLAESDHYDSNEDSYSANMNGQQYTAANDTNEDSEPYKDFAYEEDDDTEESHYYAENDTQDAYGDVSGEEELLA